MKASIDIRRTTGVGGGAHEYNLFNDLETAGGSFSAESEDPKTKLNDCVSWPFILLWTKTIDGIDFRQLHFKLLKKSAQLLSLDFHFPPLLDDDAGNLVDLQGFAIQESLVSLLAQSSLTRRLVFQRQVADTAAQVDDI